MNVKGKITAISTKNTEAGTLVVVELDHAQCVEMTILPGAWEKYRDKLDVGGEFSMETDEEPKWEWGKIPRVPK